MVNWQSPNKRFCFNLPKSWSSPPLGFVDKRMIGCWPCPMGQGEQPITAVIRLYKRAPETPLQQCICQIIDRIEYSRKPRSLSTSTAEAGKAVYTNVLLTNFLLKLGMRHQLARKISFFLIGELYRDRRWSWLGHVLRMPEHRLVRQVLLNCVRPTHETIFADVPNLSIENATKCLSIGSYGVAIGPHCACQPL